jgi:hypothetical protein
MLAGNILNSNAASQLSPPENAPFQNQVKTAGGVFVG